MAYLSKNKQVKCLHCNTLLDNKKQKTNKFCGSSCAATFNNLNRKKKPKPVAVCKGCNVEYNPSKSSLGLYCSISCQTEFFYKNRVQNWLKGVYTPKSRAFIKKYLTKTQGYSCSCCGISEWNDKLLILEIDHIDGNPENTVPENLRFICPNCHSQTDTYKGKNKGNGRHNRKLRYAKGLSY